MTGPAEQGPVPISIAAGTGFRYKPVRFQGQIAMPRCPSIQRREQTRPSARLGFAWICVAGCLVAGWLGAGCNAIHVNGLADRIAPSNNRDWSPDLSQLSYGTSDPETGEVTITNIRNCEYVTEHDFVVNRYDRTFQLDDVESVDFIVVPFNETAALAHTMLSFGLRDGTWLTVSIEIRTEKKEKFNPLLGTTRQYELIYLFADERDLIRLRTRYRDADVYVYPTVATPEQSRKLLLGMIERANQLAREPEFYNTLTNNCTTNLAGHVNTLADNRIRYGWKVLLPGFSDKYAYDLGLLRNDVPFEDLRAMAYVNDLAEVHFNDPDFSRKIRARRGQIDRLAARERQRVAATNRRELR